MGRKENVISSTLQYRRKEKKKDAVLFFIKTQSREAKKKRTVKLGE